MTGETTPVCLLKLEKVGQLKLSLTKLARAQVQATILSFYDSNRAKEPQINGSNASWSKLDREIKEKA